METQRQLITNAHTAHSSMPAKLSRKSSSPVPDDATVSLAARKETRIKELERDAHRQKIFQERSNEALAIPNGYLKVAVKIIRWDESIDDFAGHTEEISRLQSIFQDMFGYECSVHSINDRKRPQLDLNKAILDHVHTHDSPHSLLIFYYMGHGFNVEGIGLEMSANEDYSHPKGRHKATAYWCKAEATIRNDMEGDALVILDCCMASSAIPKCANPRPRIYQLLAASSREGYTAGPGPNSFTNALCTSLKELLDEATDGTFLLSQLSERINTKRATQACLTWHPIQGYKRTVQLGRLNHTQERKEAFENEELEEASLTLRLSLKAENLTTEQIQGLAEQLPQACHEAKIPLLRVYWERMTARKDDLSRANAVDHNALFETTRGDLFDAVQSDFLDVAQNALLETPTGGFYEAARKLDRVRKVCATLKRKQDSRRSERDKPDAAIIICARTIIMMFVVLGSSLFISETSERLIVFGAGVVLVLADCKMRTLEYGLEWDRRRRGSIRG